MFRSVADFLDPKNQHQPTEAERDLIKACQTGKRHIVGDGTLPPDGTPNPDITVRASLLRLLIMGGTPKCGLHESGVWLEGAVITGELDLRYVTGRGRLALHNCRFDTEPDLTQARLDQLSLEGSTLPGLFAQGAVIKGDLFLRRITATATVDVNRAEIGGQLTCSGANLDGAGGMALNAHGAKVTGTVFLCAMLHDGKLQPFTAKGTVFFVGAEIGGQLACQGANLDGAGGRALNAQGAEVTGSVFLGTLPHDGKLQPFTAKGTVFFMGAEIGGQLDCSGVNLDGAEGEALNAQGARVGDGFFFREVISVKGEIELSAAHVSDLVDDAQSWQKCRNGWNLTGFSFDRISGSGIAPKTFATRKDWLAQGSVINGEFSPQPYTQLAKVFRAAGDMGEARKVLMERDRLLGIEARKANLATLTAARAGAPWDVGNAWLRLHLVGGWDWLSRQVIGYGHAPQRALWVALGLVGAGAVLFFLAWQAGVMVPNSAVILTSDDWLKAMADPALRPPHAWMGLPSATHYETFYSLPYALDVFLPLVSIGQENAWAATTDIGFGKVIRWFTFAYQIAGWVVTSLGIAAITGFVQRGSPD